jgi:hypothetical protein
VDYAHFSFVVSGMMADIAVRMCWTNAGAAAAGEICVQ